MDNAPGDAPHVPGADRPDNERRSEMTWSHRKGVGAATLVSAVAAAVVFSHSPIARGQDGEGGDGDGGRIVQGYRIAPVKLNLHGKNRALVGLGSYIVNAEGGCNDCHTAPPYAVGGDPYQGQPKKVNADGYLGGGTSFGPFVSRNLTPDKSGRPVGGDSFATFRLVMRTGVDLDNVHPQISPLLQVMPWPVYQSMTDHDLRAIYEYLSAIPCVEGGPGSPPNRCK
ncbi:MAG: cytochrome C [Casimicrobiaceae bacterium]